MLRVAKVTVRVSIVIFTFCILLPIFTSIFDEVNKRLNLVNNLIAFGSLVLAALAFLVASLSYQAALVRPKLVLRIRPYSYGALSVEEAFTVPIRGKNICITRPFTEWNIFLENRGDSTAKYPLVHMKLDGAFLSEEFFYGWKATMHEHGRGFYGFEWSPGNDLVVHPGFPIQLPTIYLSGMPIAEHALERKELLVEFQYVADGQEVEKHTIRVKLNIIE